MNYAASQNKRHLRPLLVIGGRAAIFSRLVSVGRAGGTARDTGAAPRIRGVDWIELPNT
jgi:hypothetical protein